MEGITLIGGEHEVRTPRGELLRVDEAALAPFRVDRSAAMEAVGREVREHAHPVTQTLRQAAGTGTEEARARDQAAGTFEERTRLSTERLQGALAEPRVPTALSRLQDAVRSRAVRKTPPHQPRAASATSGEGDPG